MHTLNDRMAISASQIVDFRARGHVQLEGVLRPEEVPVWREIIREATFRHNTETRKLEERDTYGKAFLQVMNLWEVDERVRAFTLAQRFAGIAAQLLGVSRVRLYHDQALYKEAGGGLTPWHQDQYYWPLNTEKTVTMWMPLVDISEGMGMLTFASGSQMDGRVGNIAISDESESLLEEHIQRQGYPIHRAETIKAGDATWHYGWTLHSAPGNASSQTREVMTIIYFSDGAVVTAPVNHHQEADRKRWLGGLEAGSAAASALNPLL